MDVRTNYNSNCPACISIQALIGKEKLETDPANTYWGGGAYQKEVEHLQMGVWPCSDCEGQGFNWITIQETPVFIREKEPCVPCSRMGSIQLHAPLLIGGVHENLLGRAASLLRDYNQNGNCNILEMGQDEECYECGGTGERDCYNCDGGTEDCYRCDGTGEIEDEKGEDEVCSDCDGTGEEVCSDCEGENWCVECGGSGEFWNENLISGIKETYQDAIDYIYANANDSQVRTALNQLVQGLESGQLRTTSGSEMYNEANKKLYNDLHDALIYYVINTPNRPVPAEDESFSAETFAADCCRECGRKEGPYADTVLIGCPNCPELTCQHCYDETNQSCEFCVKKQAENIPNGLVVKNFKTTSKIYYNQNLVRQFKGSRHREEADSVAEVYFRRLSLNPNYFNYRFRAETFESEETPPYHRHPHREMCLECGSGSLILCSNCGSCKKCCRPLKRNQCVDCGNRCCPIDENNEWKIVEGGKHCFTCLGVYDAESFEAETFESEGKPTTIQVKRSTNDEKKLMAVFTYPDGKTKTTHFGQRGASDYTKHGEKKRMELYLERHAGNAPSYTTSSREDWKDPTTAGALSRWILWNKPSLSASFNDFKKRFNLNGDLKVKKSSETFEDKVQYIIFNTKQSRQMPTHIIKVMDERLDFKTLCGMYIKGKGWNNAGVPAKISSKDNPSGLCYKCVEKKSETFESDETFRAPMNYRESFIGTCQNEDLINDIFGSVTNFAQAIDEHGDNFKYGRYIIKYDEDSDIHSFYLNDHKSKRLLRKWDPSTQKHVWYAETFEAEEENAKKLSEYEKTYGKKQAKIRMRLKKKIYKEKSMGTKAGQWSARKSQKLKREYEAACKRADLNPYKGRKTEKQDNLKDWSDQDWKTSSGKKSSKTGEPYFPAKAVAALKKKGLYAKAKRQKANATKEGKQNARYSDDIRKVVTKYRADDNLEIDNTWRDSVQGFESEETFGANNIGSLNYPSLLMFNYWNSKLPRLTYEEYVNANNLGYGLEKLLEINSVPERCEHKNTEPDDVFIFEDDWQPWPGEVTQYYHVELMWQCPDCTRVGSASADYETEGEFWGTDPHMYDVFWEDKTRIIPFRGDHPDNYRELPSTNENSWSSVFGAETFKLPSRMALKW
tara:strand:- start:2119 stop:5502 length:3384 start_codon:yes stop_codon:yes gene_type:complete